MPIITDSPHPSQTTKRGSLCQVISNDRLAMEGNHNNVDKPWVPVNTVIEVEFVIPFAGEHPVIKFTHNGVVGYLPSLDLRVLSALSTEGK